MSTDPTTQVLKDLATNLASIRRHQMDTDLEEADPCGHIISTLHHARRGLPIFAECRRAEGHTDVHEDEYGRCWHRNGLLVETDGT